MGMFDYVHCDYPLDAECGKDFQSKDLGCDMSPVRITKDGRLEVRPILRYEDKSDSNAEPGSIASLHGCMSAVYDDWKDLHYHGIFNFYNTMPGGGWIEYNAKFTDGKIVSIERVKDDRSF